MLVVALPFVPFVPLAGLFLHQSCTSALPLFDFGLPKSEGGFVVIQCARREKTRLWPPVREFINAWATSESSKVRDKLPTFFAQWENSGS